MAAVPGGQKHAQGESGNQTCLGSAMDKERYLEWNNQIIAEFRANEGKVGGQFEGAPILLLHTIGARSGEERVTPMMYLQLGERRFVFASAAGADRHPAWFHNLVANPDVTVEVGTETLAARAVPLSGDERDRVFDEQATRYPAFRGYAEKTDRTIPVVELITD